MLKIWSDRNFHHGGECHILIPWWGGDEPDPQDPDSGRFKQWKHDGPIIFRMEDRLEDADIAVYPGHPSSDMKIFEEFQKISENAGKPIIAFFNDDDDFMIPFGPNTLLFRTSFYKSSQRPREFALPGWSKDWGMMPPCPWTKKPSISFCGSLDSRNIRRTAISRLQSNSDVECSFIPKTQFWGGWIASGRKTEIGMRVRHEFLSNINGSGYVLCARGGGNFSYRIYETMMSGRIPVLINTDCVLPYDFMILWKDMFPIVNFDNVDQLPSRLIQFHQTLNPKEFIERQLEMRRLWEEWISPTGFFSHLHKHLK